jgi:hypothetical protein
VAWIATAALSLPGAPAVFAVFAGNYQRATSPVPQKSWSSVTPPEPGTARRFAVNPPKIRKKAILKLPRLHATNPPFAAA